MNPLLSAISRFFRIPPHGCGRTARCYGGGHRKPKRASLRVEQLEDRAVPTASISIADATVREQGNLTVFASGDASTLARPSGLVFGPDRNNDGIPDLYVLRNDTGSQGIKVYDGVTGAFVEVFADASSGINKSAWLTLGADGSLYTSTDPGSGTRDTILRFDQSKNVTTFISPTHPGGNGGLKDAKGMTFGPDGNFYVASSGTNQVLRYNGATGDFIDAFVSAGSGGLSVPSAVLFGPDRNNDGVPDLYVSSYATNQVLVYSGSDGSFLSAFVTAGSGGLNGPHNMQFGTADGNLYVVNSATAYPEVLRFDGTSGAFIDKPIATGSGIGPQTTFIAFDRHGELYAGSQRANEILRDATGPLVTLSESIQSTVTVDFNTTDGTATNGSDYATISGRLTFAPGETSKRIIVSPVDDGVLESTESFNVNLANASGATIADGQAVVTILNTQTKFFVIDDAPINDRAYKYESSGAGISPETLDLGDAAPRGIAANAAGTNYWVADANKNVYMYDRNGVLLGSWSAGGLNSSAQIEGIATNGTDIWLVDSYSDKVYKFTGAASRLSGSQSAASSFKLNRSDTNPQDIVTDGTSFWVVDGSALKVFKYTLSGSLLGSWSIDPADTHPTGITINPNNLSDVWIVDNGTDKVYQYIGAASRTSGSQSAGATFSLNPYDTNPQGIADPPTADMPITPAAVNSTRNGQGTTAASSTSVPRSAKPTSAADQLFANVAGILTNARNAYRSELSAVAALLQSVETLASQRLDALLSMEAGAMGMSKDTRMSELLLAVSRS